MNNLKPFHESVIDSIKDVFKNFRERILNPELNENITPVMASYCLISELELLVKLIENTIVPDNKLCAFEENISSIVTDLILVNDHSDNLKYLDDSEYRKVLLRLNEALKKRSTN